MTAEQKERARHEVEVEKARQLKRIADALELMTDVDEDLKMEETDELKIMIKRLQDRLAKAERRIEAIAIASINKED